MESPVRQDVPAGTRLIETFGYVPGQSVARLDLHLPGQGCGADAGDRRFRGIPRLIS